MSPRWPIGEPQPDLLTQGAGGVGRFLMLNPGGGAGVEGQIWIGTGNGPPTNGTVGTGDGAGWAPIGSLFIDAVNGNMYINNGTMASPTWDMFEASGQTEVFSAIGGLTAHSGGGKTSALALTHQINGVSTVAADNDSVLLPPALAGSLAIVTNSGANGMAAYGAGTDTINSVATATLFYIAVGQTVVFWCNTAGNWNTPIATTGAATESQPSNPVAPANTGTFFMQGLAGAITPKKTGNILVTIRGNIIGTSTTAGDGIIIQGSFGTGVAPANAAALAGTQKGAVQEYTNPATVTAVDINVPFSLTFLIAAAALDTALWLDLAAKSVATVSTVKLANVDITAVEIG